MGRFANGDSAEVSLFHFANASPCAPSDFSEQDGDELLVDARETSKLARELDHYYDRSGASKTEQQKLYWPCRYQNGGRLSYSAEDPRDFDAEALARHPHAAEPPQWAAPISLDAIRRGLACGGSRVRG